MTTTITASSADLKWWKSAVVYQIYPASFNDANGDGFGDLQGILNKLDYLKSLGIDAVWISPFYATPNYDMGYDISDYQRPDDKYGKLEEVDAIIKGCHERGLKILFDLVINHTSHQHRWFQEAQKSKDNPYRKYYMWAPPRFDENGKRMPPTNWRGVWSPSVWEWSEQTGEYYLHYFAPEQPDLNWELEEVRDAVFQEAIIYWLDRGVDGFRIDTSDMYSKRLPFEDVEVVDPHNYGQPYTYGDGPRLQEFLTEMAEKTFNKYDAVTIAEKGGESTVENMLTVVGAKEKKFSMAIRFDLVRADHDDKHYLYEKKMPLTVMKKVNEACQELAEPRHDAWLCNYLENHDQARSVSRFADESPAHRAMSARMLAIHLTTLSGTLLLYQGQEIGMINMPKDWPVDEYKDTMSIEYWRDIQKAVKDGVDGYNMDGALRGLQKLARDHARTPMQWSGEAMGGFTTGSETWMRVMDSYKDINVADQEKDSNSPLNFWRKMIALRKEHQSTFIFGKFDLIDEANEKTFCYTKTSYTSDDVLFVALNFTGDAQAVELPESLKGKGEPILLASAAPARTGFVGELQPWEGVVYLFK